MKLGKYYIPDITFSQSIEIVKTIYNNKITSNDALATKMGHTTTNSGGFIIKLVTLRQLGLIKSGVKGIELTSLGQKIARPIKGEEKQFYKEMFSHTPVMNDLRKKFGSKTPDRDGMLLALIDLTGLERSILDKEVFRIQKLYNDAMKYLFVIPDTFENSDTGGFEIENTTADLSQIMEIKMGALYMRLPKNLEAIEQAEIMLNAQKQALEKKQKKQ